MEIEITAEQLLSTKSPINYIKVAVINLYLISYRDSFNKNISETVDILASQLSDNILKNIGYIEIIGKNIISKNAEIGEDVTEYYSVLLPIIYSNVVIIDKLNYLINTINDYTEKYCNDELKLDELMFNMKEESNKILKNIFDLTSELTYFAKFYDMFYNEFISNHFGVKIASPDSIKYLIDMTLSNINTSIIEEMSAGEFEQVYNIAYSEFIEYGNKKLDIDSVLSNVIESEQHFRDSLISLRDKVKYYEYIGDEKSLKKTIKLIDEVTKLALVCAEEFVVETILNEYKCLNAKYKGLLKYKCIK